MIKPSLPTAIVSTIVFAFVQQALIQYNPTSRIGSLLVGILEIALVIALILIWVYWYKGRKGNKEDMK